MALVFIGLGSNLGAGRLNLPKAWKLIGSHAQITLLSLSSPYLSEPVDMETQSWFTNAVGALETKLAPAELLRELLLVEKKMGRDRRLGKDRVIDLDILYYDDLVLHTPDLDIPHPEMHKRLFVLAPLEELTPDRIHPALQQSSRHMRRTVQATYKVKRMSW